MRKLWIVTAGLLAPVAAPALAASHMAPTPHGPPNIPNTFVCKVLPRYGGGVCTSPPYPHLGARCSCEGPRGPRLGVIAPR
jgi:hypothetical protein